MTGLIGLGFTLDVLRVDELWNLRVSEDVVATGGSTELEPEGLDQSREVAEPDILQ